MSTMKLRPNLPERGPFQPPPGKPGEWPAGVQESGREYTGAASPSDGQLANLRTYQLQTRCPFVGLLPYSFLLPSFQ